MTRNCQIITDSPCDLTAEYLAEHDVKYLPFSYTEAGKPDGGLHGVDDLFQSHSAHEFYEGIRNGASPKTSQPSQGEFDKAFRQIIQAGEPTVYLCFSSGISGCYNGACAVLDRLREEYGADNVPLQIVDLRIGSTSQTLLVIEAIRQRDRGLTADQMVAWASDARYHVQTVFTLDNLDALRRGGRIPPAAAKLASLLDAKPLLSWDLEGELTILGVARGRKKSIKKMVSYFKKYHDSDAYRSEVAGDDGGEVVCLGNADCADEEPGLEEMVRQVDPNASFVVNTIGPTIGCHVGPGMMSLCFWGADRRNGKIDTGKR